MSYGTLIQTVTVGAGGAASIDFTSIPQTYTDLLVVFSGRNANASASTGQFLFINGVQTNRSFRNLNGNGSSAVSGNGTDGYIGNTNASTATANTFANCQIYIPNYASTTTNKAFSVDNVQETNAASANQDLIAGVWSQTSAITSLSLSASGGNLLQYSTASLYGIK